MKVIIEIDETELEIKKAIAKGWNERFGEELTHKDISEVSAKDDILSAIPYLNREKIEVEVEK
jgi:hypothetical protein